ncbi:FecR family protein [Neotamlana laminarinivorans]|uniref:FecR family protein n=1 Tax=Neotamlana laminarinivorans TaxID=2883124 RepID=A0A9X1HZZ1_9FLAO|nr:FecR family protein [Tamlana laminarinivorans]MCB4798666.1 FecR family protein [Tamlana laminarinivorans]
MNKEQDILKWFEGEISTADIKKRYPNEDFSVLEKAGFYAKQIEAPKVDAQAALADFKTRSFKKDAPKVIPLQIKQFLRVAAILVVLLTSSYFLFFNNTKSINTEIAETKTFNLPDESEVVLNAKSTLDYNKKTWKTERNLNLSGEAYFKVTKGQKFTVKTEAGNVQVLGTQFNVKQRANYFEVTCYEGSVSVTSSQNKVVLKPGETFRIVDNKVVTVANANENAPSWLRQESSFKNVPLWQVVNELENQYNINVSTNSINANALFSGSFTHNNLNIALQSVTIPLKLSYKINDNNVEFYNYEAK